MFGRFRKLHGVLFLRYATFVLYIMIFNINIRRLLYNNAIFVDVMVRIVDIPASD